MTRDRTYQNELIKMAEDLATANGHLAVELLRVRAELAELRRSKQLASMRGDRRQIERAVMDARFLGGLHAAGLATSRRADTHGLSRWRHESALGILRLGGVFGVRGWRTVDPVAIAEGVELGRGRALASPERWRLRLPDHRLRLG